jgi:superfamily II DNA or RNA helicase
MILRPRQAAFVERSIQALKDKGSAIGIAPTGAGKTVILSAVAGNYARPLILQHRTELVDQNRRTFSLVNPKTKTDLYTADRKNFSSGATFAMAQTLARESNLADIPSGMDLLVVDEAHHAAAKSYRNIVDAFLEANPDAHIFGVTATPNRADKKALVEIFSCVSDQIELHELVAGGFLVKPRCFALDLGVKEELSGVTKTASEFDMGEVSEIMDKRPLNDKIVEKWRELAGERQTVVFCSTIEHSEHLCAAFIDAGVRATTISGEMSKVDRRTTLSEFDQGKWQVICNVAVLTEGWDCQPVSCVILARPCSAKSTMMQMVGRGLRKLDVSRYPGKSKTDCIILDFGFSIVTHGDFEMRPNLDPDIQVSGEAPTKVCPNCGIEVSASKRQCPVCEYIWDRAEQEFGTLEEFTMTEVAMLDASPFRWESLFDDLVLMANGITAWVAIVTFAGKMQVLGGRVGEHRLDTIDCGTDRPLLIASADDFLRQHGDMDSSKKSKSWLSLPPTPKQIELIGSGKISPFNCSRYRASCIITWMFNEKKIQSRLLTVR